MVCPVCIPKRRVGPEVPRTHAEIASACCSSLIDALLLHTVSTTPSIQPSGKSVKFWKKYIMYDQGNYMLYYTSFIIEHVIALIIHSIFFPEFYRFS
jgi:hypothetical protein